MALDVMGVCCSEMKMQDIELDIRTRLLSAQAADDTAGIVRGLHDLESIGWKEVSIVSRHIGIHGERLERRVWLNGRHARIMCGSGAFRLIWELRFRSMVKDKHYKWLKHLNDMSPEEYEWVHF
jgi:hypothetical protein